MSVGGEGGRRGGSVEGGKDRVAKRRVKEANIVSL